VCRANKAGGFSLLEMVVAIAIFSVIAIVSYASLSRFLNTYETLGARDAKFREVELSFARLARDFRYSADRSVRDEYGDNQPALLVEPDQPPVSGEMMRLTVSAPDVNINSLGDLRRVAWRLEDGKLVRVQWSVLDGAVEEESISQTVLGGVDSVNVQLIFVDQQNNLKYLDTYNGTGDRPRGVEIELSLKDGRRYQRVFQLSDAT
jgi:general secretion pathway protein J